MVSKRLSTQYGELFASDNLCTVEAPTADLLKTALDMCHMYMSLSESYQLNK